MKIRNDTRYSTRLLHSIFTATYHDLAKVEGELSGWKHYTFDVVYARTKDYTGHAFIKGAWAKIRLPKRVANVVDIANLVEHELLHSYGYKHGAMGGAHYPWTGRHNVQRNKALLAKFGAAISETEPKARPKQDIQTHRHQLVLAGIARWESKLKAAQTRLKNLRQKKRYYEKALAAKRGESR